MNLPHWHHWRAKSKWHQWSSGFGQTTLLQKSVSLKTSCPSLAWSSALPWLQNCNVGWYLPRGRTQPIQRNEANMFCFFFLLDFIMFRQEKNRYHRSHCKCVHRLNRTKQDCTQTSHASLLPFRKVHCRQSPERWHWKVLLCRSGYVMTQIPGDPKFGPWPQVKGLTIRVSLIPRWQSTKTLWNFFIFFTYKS